MNPFPPALSFSSNPDFKDLVETVVESSDPITVICGAGVSMGAGLPSWSALIKAMSEDVPGVYRKWLNQDGLDLARRVSVVEAFLPPHIHRPDAIRRALYECVGGEPEPGRLALAIADFALTVAKTRPEGIRIVTTNYDDLLEQAIVVVRNARSKRRETSSRSSTSKCQSLVIGDTVKRQHEGARSVLHLHGFIPAEGRSRGRIILGEADFAVHSADVQHQLQCILESSHVIFVGMSMTDPNIVGPLLRKSRTEKTADKSYSRFAIVPPEWPADQRTDRAMMMSEEDREHFRYVRDRERKIGAFLGVQPVFMNAISQLSQLFSELALAVRLPKEYKDDHSRSIRYGNRLHTYVDQIHEYLGLRKDGKPTWNLSRQLEVTQEMNNELSNIKPALKKLARRADQRRATGHFIADLVSDERFGLLLWARSLRDTNGNCDYSLDLVGNSQQTYQNEWSGTNKTPVSPRSDTPAGNAVYFGHVTVASSSGSQWRSILTVPLSFFIRGGGVTCGAMMICSERPLMTEVDETKAGSIIGYLEGQELTDFANLLGEVGKGLFPSLPG